LVNTNGTLTNAPAGVVNRIVVLGGGSAGFLAAITLKYRLPDVPITLIRSPDIGIIGVGESTTAAVPVHLHHYLKLDIGEFFRKAEPFWKLGIRFLWGKRPYFDYAFGNQMDCKFHILKKGTGFYCDEGPFDYVGILSGLMTHNSIWLRQPNGQPLIHGDYAYHIENVHFVAYLEGVAARMGVVVKDDKVVEVLQNDNGVAGLRLESGPVETADLYVDCSGFVSLLLGKTLKEPYISFKSSLYNDRAVISWWNRTDEPMQPYTTAETMNCGWCWRIDHEHQVARGYVYSSDFISDDEADAEFRAKNPQVKDTRVVKYRTGRFERAWVKNVVGVGNACGFVEPLESTGLGAICAQSQALAETLVDCDRRPRPSSLKQYNKRHAKDWDTIRQFLAMHFKFNERLDNTYWRACRADADLASAAEIVEFYKENGPTVVWRIMLIDDADPFNMEGYLSMLVGQQVPYQKTFVPDAQEWNSWQQIRQGIYHRASRAFSVKEAFALIRSPDWVWPSWLFNNSPAVRNWGAALTKT